MRHQLTHIRKATMGKRKKKKKEEKIVFAKMWKN